MNALPVRIVVAEDSPTQAKCQCMLLERGGYDVEIALNGKVALAACLRAPPALLVSDIVMPEMDGYELCRQVKSHPLLKQTPVILLSSLSDPRDVLSALEAGADHFLPKLSVGHDLLPRIQSLLAPQSTTHACHAKDVTDARMMGDGPDQAASSRPGPEDENEEVTIRFGGNDFAISSPRSRVLRFLVTTYENACRQNAELMQSQLALERFSRDLEMEIEERMKAQQLVALRADLSQGLQKAGEELSRCRTIGKVVACAVDVPVRELGMKMAWVTRQASHGANHRIAFVGTDHEAAACVSDACSEKAVACREAVIVADATETPPCAACLAAAQQDGCRCCITFPICVAGVPTATLTIRDTEPGAEGHLMLAEPLLDIFCRQLSAAWERCLIEFHLLDARDAADKANAAKSDFLASMSHELRTPLNAIIGFSDVLRDPAFGALDERQTGYARDINESGRHLLSLVNDILDLAKVEAGKMELELSSFRLGDLLDHSLIMVREKAMHHSIALSLELADELQDVEITADERKLKQIMFNLLSNAAKFTQDGGSITVAAAWGNGRESERRGQERRGRAPCGRTEESDCNGQSPMPDDGPKEHMPCDIRSCDLIEISVSDTGTGITAADQERIFEKFFQVKADQAGKTPGTGLGLSLVNQLVELHGGAVSVASDGVGRGSRFAFTIPRVCQPQPEADNVGERKSVGGVRSDETRIETAILRLISLFERRARPFAVCVFESDDGAHEACSQKLSDLLSTGKRDYDVVCRNENGGKYLVLLESDKAGAEAACERFRRRYRELASVDCSFHVYACPEDLSSLRVIAGLATDGAVDDNQP